MQTTTGRWSSVRLVIAAGALVLTAGRTLAAEQLSLHEAVSRGVRANPILTGARADLDAAAARKRMAASALYPQVTISETYSDTDNPMWAFGTRLNQQRIEQPDFNPELLNDPDAIHNWNTTLTLNWLLFDGGRSWVNVAQAGRDREARDLLLERARQEVIGQVVASYALVLYAEESITVVDQALDTARAHRGLAQDLYETGLAVKSDFLRAQVRVAEVEQQKLTAERQRDLARASLNAAMGEDLGREFDLTSDLRSAACADRTMDEYIKQALDRRADLKAARIFVDMSDQEIDKARLAFLPSVYVTGQWQMDSENLRDQAYSRNAAAVASLDLFSGFRRAARADEAEADSAKARAMNEQLALGVELQTRDAYLELESSCRRVGVASAAVEAAAETMRIVADRYRTGLYTMVALMDAETALEAARAAEVQARRDNTLARSRLLLAAGVLGEDFQ